MKQQSRINSSVKNVSYSVIIVILNTLVSFVSRTFLVKILGTEVLGLNGLFTEVISMMSLAELGIGMAIVYSLYKPLHENDTEQISKLMSLYKDAYRIIAVVTFLIGVFLTFFIDKLITDIYYPLWYIRIIFILFVVRTSSSYLFSYKTSLLNADQKQYIVSLANSIIKVISTVVTVVFLCITKNYIIYLIIQIAQVIVVNGLLSLYVDKKYTYLDYSKRIDKKERDIIFDNIKNIFIKRVSGVVTSSTDNILISTLVSTIQVGYYSNYVVIFSIIRTFYKQITGGISASIGNLMVSENPEKCILVLKRLSFLYFILASIMASGLLAVSDLFITLWIGEEYVMASTIVLTAIVNVFLEIMCEPIWQYLEVSGLFNKDKNIGIFGSVVNLIVSVVLGLKIGIVGIFIGTICTQVIQLILKTWILFKSRFEVAPTKYYIQIVKMLVGFVLIVLIQKYSFVYVYITNQYLLFIIKGMLSVLLAVIVCFVLFVNTEEEKYSLVLVKKVCSRILRGNNNG